MSVKQTLGKVSITPVGVWSSQSEYLALDCVTNNGSSYLAKKNVPAGTSLLNTEYWQLIAQKGEQGPAGEPDAYLKNAAASGNTLTLTKKDDSTVVYTPTVPTKTSDLVNDSGFLTEHQSLAAYRTSAAQDIIDSGKQSTISDLETIRSGAALGATALQSVPDTYRTSADQDLIDATKLDILTAGENVSIVDNVISATDTTYSAGTNVQINNNVISATDTTYSPVTTSSNGLMTSTDKTKLDGIYSGATATSVSDTGTSTDKVKYITIDGVESKVSFDVIDNVLSTSTDDALSANMGKSLQDSINNLKNIGRFLSIWNASTGAPSTEPNESPYSYKVGDYYRIGAAGTKNPANNSTYTTGGTNWVEGASLGIGDVVYVSNISGSTSTWAKQSSGGGGTVQDVQVNGTSIVASGTGIANITDAALANVKYTAQSLTDTQKTQARTNIGAIALEEYDSSATPVDGILYYVTE